MKNHRADCKLDAPGTPLYAECDCPEAEEKIKASILFDGKACEPFIVADPDFREVDEPEPAPVEQLGEKLARMLGGDPMSIDENGLLRFLPAMQAALHKLRVEFLDWQFREFPMAGADAVRCMARVGLCTQAEADAAIAEAREKWIASLIADALAPHVPEDAAAIRAYDERVAGGLDDEMPF